MEQLKVLIVLAATLLHVIVGASSGLDDEPFLSLGYYKETCPLAEDIVRRVVKIAVLKDPRMAASLLRLHFHDCFVMGCDGSVLLDSNGDMKSEKEAGPNINSLRGFEVIDEIKYLLEETCFYTVSCADILAIAARDAVELRGGPRWEVWLGRKDSLKASFDGANKFIPAPNLSLEGLIDNFKEQGLNIEDLVALSGSHTMGKAKCSSFKQRIYNMPIEQHYDRYKRHTTFRRILKSMCPESERNNHLVPLDYLSPTRFDNSYFLNILQGKGLLGSDNVLFSQDEDGEVRKQVLNYANDEKLFFDSFAKSMIKMGYINVLTGNQGEIRKKCRFVNK